MIAHLDMHLLDLYQNALASGASEIDVLVRCETQRDRLTLGVSDDGKGMDEEALRAAERGFLSSKCGGYVGLGIPLLRQTAEHCDGAFYIKSEPGRGTAVKASFRLGHIDLPPFDDLAETFVVMLVTNDGRRVRVRYENDGMSFDLDTAVLAEYLDGLPLGDPDVIEFLRAYIGERIVAWRPVLDPVHRAPKTERRLGKLAPPHGGEPGEEAASILERAPATPDRRLPQ
jgi:hypothetical protein